jgi:hypothetical protein
MNARDRITIHRPPRIARACLALRRRRNEWLARSAAFGTASSRHARQVGKRITLVAGVNRGKHQSLGFNPGVSSRAPVRLAPAQRRTIETGSWVVLSALGVEVQFASWPGWTFVALIAIYAAWIVAYAEITVQTARPRRSSLQWPYRSRPSGGIRLPASASVPQPEAEQATT